MAVQVRQEKSVQGACAERQGQMLKPELKIKHS